MKLLHFFEIAPHVAKIGPNSGVGEVSHAHRWCFTRQMSESKQRPAVCLELLIPLYHLQKASWKIWWHRYHGIINALRRHRSGALLARASRLLKRGNGGVATGHQRATGSPKSRLTLTSYWKPLFWVIPPVLGDPPISKEIQPNTEGEWNFPTGIHVETLCGDIQPTSTNNFMFWKSSLLSLLHHPSEGHLQRTCRPCLLKMVMCHLQRSRKYRIPMDTPQWHVLRPPFLYWNWMEIVKDNKFIMFLVVYSIINPQFLVQIHVWLNPPSKNLQHIHLPLSTLLQGLPYLIVSPRKVWNQDGSMMFTS